MASSLIIVSNRLPISVKRVEGRLEFYPSVGGLATGLAAYTSDKRNKWIGWPGIPSDQLTRAEREQITEKLRENNCYPVFLNQRQLDDFYNGYSNTILWPLFHDLKARMEDHDRFYKAYRAVNNAFAEVVLALSDNVSKIWVHDYQLMLVPAFLRAARPKAKIGFFLHIPFPTPAHFRRLSSARHLLYGVLGADLIGLHTKAYVKHFLDATRDLTYEIVEDGPPSRVMLAAHVSRVMDFPIGIDYERFTKARNLEGVKAELEKHQAKYKGLKVILTVDRLDPTKGLVERLEAYQEFLRRNPTFRGKVIMVMLAVPSRTDIEEYKLLRKRVEKLVKAIEDEFQTPAWQPIDYMYTSMPVESVTALYQVADVAFITPLRDGMNLVAKEYVASRPRHDGALILSSTAGAAQELTDALLVNPRQRESLVEGLTNALKLPKRELRRRISAMNEQISTHTVQHWAGNFMNTLTRPIPGTRHLTRTLTPARVQDLVTAYRLAERPLLLLDYDGVLSPLVADPKKAAPRERTLELLHDLSESGLHIGIISGRTQADLERWLNDVPVSLVAEHGALLRYYDHERRGFRPWKRLTNSLPNWQQDVLPIMEKYARRTPGAFVEVKEFSLVWHYRVASPYYSQKHLVILRRLIRPLARRYGLGVDNGNKILEVKPQDINKGAAVELLASEYPGDEPPDFVLCIGDDATDEDMFDTLPITSYTVKIGRTATGARFRLHTIRDVQPLLEKLIK